MESLPIGDSNAAQLTERLADLGARLMVKVLADLSAYPAEPQPEDGVTYAAKISKEEARLDWSRPAEALQRHVQGLAPFPGAWTEVAGERIKWLEAEAVAGEGQPGEVIDEHFTVACAEGALRPILLQRAGKGAMQVSDILRGFAIPKGSKLP